MTQVFLYFITASCANLNEISRAVQAPLPQPRYHFEALFMSSIDYAVENCFAVPGCFTSLETAENLPERKSNLIYLTLGFL